MSKWIICILISSMAGTIVYGLWLLLYRMLGKSKNVTVMYYTLRTVAAMFTILVLGGIVWATYMQLFPTNSLWLLEPTYMRLFLYLMSATWMIGAVYRLVNYTWEYILLARRVKKLEENLGYEYDVLAQTCRKVRIRRIPRLMTGADVMSPELFGLFKPMIILPEELLTESELIYIFAHELFHLKHHDRLVRELAVLTHCIHWFNPLLARLLDDIEKLDERHCDACVCDMEFTDKRAYASVLYMFCEMAVRQNRSVCNVTFSEKGANMVERMRFIENHKKGTKNKKWLTVVLACLFAVCSTTVAMGATDGMLSLYNGAVKSNLVGIEETMQSDELIEYCEYAGPEFYAELTATGGEIAPNALSTDFFEVDLEENWNSGEFTASAGQEIVLQVSMDPNNVNIKIGIVEPDKWLRYLYNCGDISHTFKLTKTGRYAIFMINETGQTVNVRGSYRTRTPN